MSEVQLQLGDCLEVLPTLKVESVQCIITDPPYGISYQSARRTDKDDRKQKLQNDDKPFIWWLYQAYRVTAQGGALLCFCEWRYQDLFRIAIECAGYTIKSQVIWDRGWHGLGDLNSSFAPQHDVIWFAVKGSFEFKNGRPKSVKRFQRISAESLVHPTEKPVSLLFDLITDISEPGDTVLDPMMGSGATGVASIKAGRKFIGIEIDEDYFNIATSRMLDTQRLIDGQPKQLTGHESDYLDSPLFAAS